MSVLLGIDLGTSSVKCILAAEYGEILAVAEQEYPILTPCPNWFEQNPDAWWQSTVTAIRELLAKQNADKQDIKAIGLSGQMHGAVFLGTKDTIIRPAIIWADQRSVAQCQRVTETIGCERLAQIAGSGIFPGFMLASLLWVKEHEPHIWEQIRHVLFPKDYIRLQLTGEIATDISDASSGLLVDIQSGTWSNELINEFSIPIEILPIILGSYEIAGTLTEEASEMLGLCAGIPVVAGAADQATGALGSGIVTPNILAATIGTGGQLVTILTSPRADKQLRTHTFCHAIPQSWYLLGATLSAGLAFRWLRDSILQEAPTGGYERMASLAQTVSPGSEGAMFLPYIVGERATGQKPQPKGLFYGLNLRHNRSHLIRAVMEGVVFSLRRILDIFEELGVKPGQIIASGGGARSDLWCQIMADVFQAPVARLDNQEQSAVGAVILAGLGIKSYSDASEACQTLVRKGSSVLPQRDTATMYNEMYELFSDLSTRLKLGGS